MACWADVVPAERLNCQAAVRAWLLDRTLRIVDAGTRPFFQAALISLAVIAGFTIMIALQVRPAGRAAVRMLSI